MRGHIFFPERVKVDGRKLAVMKSWMSEKLSVIQSYVKSNIKIHVLPGRSMVEDSQRRFSVLKQRLWRIIKAKVNNLIINDRRKNTE